jgi:hypothetical protein
MLAEKPLLGELSIGRNLMYWYMEWKGNMIMALEEMGL